MHSMARESASNRDFGICEGSLIRRHGGGSQRKPTTAENEHSVLVFGGCGGLLMRHRRGGNQRKPTTTENEHKCSISVVVEGG